MEIDEIIRRLFDYYGISTLQELAEKMGISKASISNWKSRNSINAIERRCRDLGIYSQIFDSLTTIQRIKNQNGNNSFNNFANNNINFDEEKRVLEQELNFKNPEIIKLVKVIDSLVSGDDEKEKKIIEILKDIIRDNL